MHINPIILTPSLVTRFWKYVDQTSSPHGCWLWTASLNEHGYGRIGSDGHFGTMLPAHRVSYLIRFGSIPDDISVLHNCPGGDNPACVNPDHLWLGTHKDNSRDLWNKGNGKIVHYRGERHANAKLSNANITDIRTLYQPRIMTRKLLAQRFRVSRSAIDAVLDGKYWTHVS